jgi:hypothetical protein
MGKFAFGREVSRFGAAMQQHAVDVRLTYIKKLGVVRLTLRNRSRRWQMDPATETFRNEIRAGFDRIDDRIDEVRRLIFEARLEAIRKEGEAHTRWVNDQIVRLREQTDARIEAARRDAEQSRLRFRRECNDSWSRPGML